LKALFSLRLHGPFWRVRIVCPKPYELRLSSFLIRIASFQGGYLMSGGFVGSSLTPVVFGYQPEPSAAKIIGRESVPK